MALRTRVIRTDGAGSGSLGVPPGYFAGADGLSPSGSVTDSLDHLWTDGMIPRSDQEATQGELAITGAPADSTVVLYFDF